MVSDNLVQNLNQDTLYKLSTILHTLCCRKPHVDKMEELFSGREEDKCYYFLEESLADDRTDHEEWLNKTRGFCIEYNMQPEDAIRILPKILQIRRNLDDILEKNPN